MRFISIWKADVSRIRAGAAEAEEVNAYHKTSIALSKIYTSGIKVSALTESSHDDSHGSSRGGLQNVSPRLA